MVTKMDAVWFVLLSLMCVASFAVAANDGGSVDVGAGLLIDSDGLRAKLGSDRLRILDVRSSADYSEFHIPNAINVDVAKWKKLAFDDSHGWANTVGSLGIDSDSHVVVYGTKLSDTGRAWWLLKYAGVENVSILDGGYEWWTKSDGPTTTAVPKVATTEFKPNFQLDRLEQIDSVKKSLHSSTVNVLDTRSAEEFNAGHIPGAAHLEWKELVAADGRFKSKSELQTLFQDRGIALSESAVCY